MRTCRASLAPTLCLNGTQDALCQRDLMDAVVARLSTNWTMHWLADADHSFHVTKASGRTDAAVRDEIGDSVATWVASRHESAGCAPSYPSTILRSPIDAPFRMAIAPAYSADW